MCQTLAPALFAGFRSFSSRRLGFKGFFAIFICAESLVSKIKKVVAMGALINKVFSADGTTANRFWFCLCAEFA